MLPRRLLCRVVLIDRERIPDDTQAGRIRKCLRQQFELLCCQFRLAIKNSGDIAAGVGKARNIAALDRVVIDRQDDNGNKTARAHHCLQCDFGTVRPDQIDRRPHQFGSRDKSSAWVIHPTIVDGEILAFIKTQRLQFSQEGLVLRSRGGGITAGTKNTDAPDLARLLSARGKRPRGCTAKQRNELSPPHSITSSARVSRFGGIFRSSALAVARLITRSSLVANSTGILAGLSPLRIRPA